MAAALTFVWGILIPLVLDAIGFCPRAALQVARVAAGNTCNLSIIGSAGSSTSLPPILTDSSNPAPHTSSQKRA